MIFLNIIFCGSLLYLHIKLYVMRRSYSRFWIFYILWSTVNFALMIMALYDTFGEFDKATEKFWPFTVGSPRYYDLLELLVYLLIPLIIHFAYRKVHHHKKEIQTSQDLS